jgi:hypothetical protein
MSLMTVPEVGALRVDDEYAPDCDWCSTTHNVLWVSKAQKHLCDDCFEEWSRENAHQEPA